MLELLNIKKNTRKMVQRYRIINQLCIGYIIEMDVMRDANHILKDESNI